MKNKTNYYRYSGLAMLLLVLSIGILSCGTFSKKAEESSGNLVLQSSENIQYDRTTIPLEKIEWSNLWVLNDSNSLPRILLIGDSHVVQYYNDVKKKLEGLASCSRYASSKCFGNPFLPEEIKLILRQYSFDIICINNGLHGKDVPEETYGAAVSGVFNALQKYSDAKIIWVNTTPERIKNNLDEFDGFTNRIRTRNQLVEKYVSTIDVPVVDNFSLGKNHPEYYKKDGIHFNEQGVNAESDQIVRMIRKYLNK